MLVWRNTKLAAVEAKAVGKGVGEGVGQAKDYAERLQTRFAYACNGKAIYRIDMQTGQEGPVECWPSPQELWDATFAEANLWRDRFAAVPYETGGKLRAALLPVQRHREGAGGASRPARTACC